MEPMEPVLTKPLTGLDFAKNWVSSLVLRSFFDLFAKKYHAPSSDSHWVIGMDPEVIRDHMENLRVICILHDMTYHGASL